MPDEYVFMKGSPWELLRWLKEGMVCQAVVKQVMWYENVLCRRNFGHYVTWVQRTTEAVPAEMKETYRKFRKEIWPKYTW